jgi:hypothetical protein
LGLGGLIVENVIQNRGGDEEVALQIHEVFHFQDLLNLKAKLVVGLVGFVRHCGIDEGSQQKGDVV